ncbi:PREDICTED: pathogenesis-related protein 1C-like [Ipomoea nil]|uniref:pathogenesis-related protein 1C-like n=1 Tax=Ipomoea nil TaxID=35883 RepID=UPI000900F864|nr:PREDICTED: pathogenesis-related protein 1C-like [Ipomoea nil]
MAQGITLSIFFLLFIITFISSTDALIHHKIPRSHLNRRHVKPLSAFVPRYDWIQQEFFRARNNLRAKVGSPHPQWDSTLAKFAQDWAVRRKNDCNYRTHSNHGKYGKNIFWQLYKESTPRGVVRSWFQEQTHFDHRRNVCVCRPERVGCGCSTDDMDNQYENPNGPPTYD